MGVECENAGQFSDALSWHSRVRPGSPFDEVAIASRIAVHLVLNQPREAVGIGIKALRRLPEPTPSLVNEVARAFNIRFGPAEAFRLCLYYTDSRQGRHHRWLWLSTAAFASRCGQFADALSCLVRWLELSRGQQRENIFLDMDFRPLWRHLAQDRISHQEMAWLAAADWNAINECVRSFDGIISFESLAEVPEEFRPLFDIQSRSMNWRLRHEAGKDEIKACASWFNSACRSHYEAFIVGLRKGIALLN